MEARAWVDVIEREYLERFIPEGGAAVKFAVPRDPASREGVLALLPQVAAGRGFITATVNAAETRIHMIEEVFFRIADQIPWQRLSRLMLARVARAEGYRTPPVDGVLPATSYLDVIAEENQQDREVLRQDFRRALDQRVYRDPFLARDFRVAMNYLCRAELTSGVDADTTREIIIDWLTGRNRRIAPVKQYGIFSRIHRANARHHLEALLRWVHRVGLPGTVVLIDIERVALTRNLRDGSRYYTKAAVLDAYEVLRELIDSTDRLEWAMFVVVPAPGFLNAEPGTRGMGDYQALKFRVYDEVRDGRLVNPMAALVRLSSSAGLVAR